MAIGRLTGGSCDRGLDLRLSLILMHLKRTTLQPHVACGSNVMPRLGGAAALVGPGSRRGWGLHAAGRALCAPYGETHHAGNPRSSSPGPGRVSAGQRGQQAVKATRQVGTHAGLLACLSDRAKSPVVRE